jgi:hypothetical protein
MTSTVLLIYLLQFYCGSGRNLLTFWRSMLLQLCLQVGCLLHLVFEPEYEAVMFLLHVNKFLPGYKELYLRRQFFFSSCKDITQVFISLLPAYLLSLIKLTLNSVVWVREWTIPSKRPPLVGKVRGQLLRIKMPRGQRDGSLRPYSQISRPAFFP